MSQPSKRRRGALVPNSDAYDECVFAALLCSDIGDSGGAKDSPEALLGAAVMEGRASPCTALAKLELKGHDGAPDNAPAAPAPKISTHLSSWDEDGPLSGAAERKHSQANTIVHRRGSELGSLGSLGSPHTHRGSFWGDPPPLDKGLPGSPASSMRRRMPSKVPSPVEAAEDCDSGPDDASVCSRKRWRDVEGMDCDEGASVPVSPTLKPYMCAGTPSSAESSRAASPAGRSHLFARGSAPNIMPATYFKVLQSKLSKGGRSRRGSTGQPVRRRQSMLTLAPAGGQSSIYPWPWPDRQQRAGSTSPHSFTRELDSPPFVFMGDSPTGRNVVLSQISPLRGTCVASSEIVSNFAALAQQANMSDLDGGGDRPRSSFGPPRHAFGPGPLDTEQAPEEHTVLPLRDCVEI
mmetsp:Transcript_18569/g.45617  ORF Transcript_18569/g.45617 Transcript_18569/m.45617 type:complete len:407 (+) Transcript_18569:229-1449(+)